MPKQGETARRPVWPEDAGFRATRTPGTGCSQEDIHLDRVPYFAYAWIALGALYMWIGTVRNPVGGHRLRWAPSSSST